MRCVEAGKRKFLEFKKEHRRQGGDNSGDGVSVLKAGSSPKDSAKLGYSTRLNWSPSNLSTDSLACRWSFLALRRAYITHKWSPSRLTSNRNRPASVSAKNAFQDVLETQSSNRGKFS